MRWAEAFEADYVAMITRSGLFDGEFYLRCNPDVAAAGSASISLRGQSIGVVEARSRAAIS